MKLSILDQSPISSGKTAKDALEASVNLAQLGEKYGYTRYWIAEHHDLSGLACSAPEVMLSYIGARTNTIRIGSGAVLLPNYKPYKVAETHNLLATLFEGRIDIGVGRSPGGSAEASLALSDNFLQQMGKYPELVKELLSFLHKDFPLDHMFSKISPSPVPNHAPQPWILGTSKKSAALAAELGTGYAYAHFMRNHGTTIVDTYQNDFKANDKTLEKPYTIVAFSVICSETTEKAEELARSHYLWAIQSEKGEKNKGIPTIAEAKRYTYSNKDEEMIAKMKQKMVIGSPSVVKQKLIELQKMYKADELMILTITYDYEDRLKSYQLIAEEMLL